MEFFIFLLLILLSLLGLSEAICVFINWVLKPKCAAKKYLVVFLKKGYAEQQLLQVTENLNWRGNVVADRIVAYVGELQSDERETLKLRFCNNRNVVFTDALNIKGI